MGKLSSVLFALSVALFFPFFRTSIQVIKKGDETGLIETQEIALRVFVVYFSSSYWSHFRQVWREPSPNLVQLSRCTTRPQSLTNRNWSTCTLVRALKSSRRWEASFSGVDIYLDANVCDNTTRQSFNLIIVSSAFLLVSEWRKLIIMNMNSLRCAIATFSRVRSPLKGVVGLMTTMLSVNCSRENFVNIPHPPHPENFRSKSSSIYLIIIISITLKFHIMNMQIKICRLEIQIHPPPHRITIISFQSLILRHKILVFYWFPHKSSPSLSV